MTVYIAGNVVSVSKRALLRTETIVDLKLRTPYGIHLCKMKSRKNIWSFHVSRIIKNFFHVHKKKKSKAVFTWTQKAFRPQIMFHVEKN